MKQLPVQAGVDDVHAHPRHTGHRWLDLVLALSAIFISLVSLFIAIEHGRTERDLVAANSWPFLQMDGTVGGPDGAQTWMANAGIGPAKLEQFDLLFDGRPVANTHRLLELCCGLSTDPALRHAQLPEGISNSSIVNEVLRPGQHQPLLSMAKSDRPDSIYARLRRTLPRISYRGCYCSVFDECWTSNFRDLHPQRVAACPISGPSFNQDFVPY